MSVNHKNKSDINKKDTYYCVFKEKLIPIPEQDVEAFNFIKNISPKKRNKAQRMFWIRYYKKYKSVPKNSQTRLIFKPGITERFLDYPRLICRYAFYFYAIAEFELFLPENWFLEAWETWFVYYDANIKNYNDTYWNAVCSRISLVGHAFLTIAIFSKWIEVWCKEKYYRLWIPHWKPRYEKLNIEYKNKRWIVWRKLFIAWFKERVKDRFIYYIYQRHVNLWNTLFNSTENIYQKSVLDHEDRWIRLFAPYLRAWTLMDLPSDKCPMLHRVQQRWDKNFNYLGDEGPWVYDLLKPNEETKDVGKVRAIPNFIYNPYKNQDPKISLRGRLYTWVSSKTHYYDVQLPAIAYYIAVVVCKHGADYNVPVKYWNPQWYFGPLWYWFRPVGHRKEYHPYDYDYETYAQKKKHWAKLKTKR